MAADGHSAMRSPRIREKRRRRQAEILHAALRAFREKGYYATTLDDIAEKLDVRKTALYYYFPDKEAILYECHRESLAEVDGFVKDARQRFTTADEQLRHIIRQHVRVIVDRHHRAPGVGRPHRTDRRMVHRHDLITLCAQQMS